MANVVNQEIVNAVKLLIKSEGITQKKFGEDFLGVGEAYISNMLKGHDVVNLDRLLDGLKRHGYEMKISVEIIKSK